MKKGGVLDILKKQNIDHYPTDIKNNIFELLGYNHKKLINLITKKIKNEITVQYENREYNLFIICDSTTDKKKTKEPTDDDTTRVFIKVQIENDVEIPWHLSIGGCSAFFVGEKKLWDSKQGCMLTHVSIDRNETTKNFYDFPTYHRKIKNTASNEHKHPIYLPLENIAELFKIFSNKVLYERLILKYDNTSNKVNYIDNNPNLTDDEKNQINLHLFLFKESILHIFRNIYYDKNYTDTGLINMKNIFDKCESKTIIDSHNTKINKDNLHFYIENYFHNFSYQLFDNKPENIDKYINSINRFKNIQSAINVNIQKINLVYNIYLKTYDFHKISFELIDEITEVSNNSFLTILTKLENNKKLIVNINDTFLENIKENEVTIIKLKKELIYTKNDNKIYYTNSFYNKDFKTSLKNNISSKSFKSNSFFNTESLSNKLYYIFIKEKLKDGLLRFVSMIYFFDFQLKRDYRDYKKKINQFFENQISVFKDLKIKEKNNRKIQPKNKSKKSSLIKNNLSIIKDIILNLNNHKKNCNNYRYIPVTEIITDPITQIKENVIKALTIDKNKTGDIISIMDQVDNWYSFIETNFEYLANDTVNKGSQTYIKTYANLDGIINKISIVFTEKNYTIYNKNTPERELFITKCKIILNQLTIIISKILNNSKKNASVSKLDDNEINSTIKKEEEHEKDVKGSKSVETKPNPIEIGTVTGTRAITSIIQKPYATLNRHFAKHYATLDKPKRNRIKVSHKNTGFIKKIMLKDGGNILRGFINKYITLEPKPVENYELYQDTQRKISKQQQESLEQQKLNFKNYNQEIRTNITLLDKIYLTNEEQIESKETEIKDNKSKIKIYKKIIKEKIQIDKISLKMSENIKEIKKFINFMYYLRLNLNYPHYLK
jgi:hypothetical protein